MLLMTAQTRNGQFGTKSGLPLWSRIAGARCHWQCSVPEADHIIAEHIEALQEERKAEGAAVNSIAESLRRFHNADRLQRPRQCLVADVFTGKLRAQDAPRFQLPI